MSFPPPSPPPASYDLDALRRAEFPWADEKYLNHASIGPLPERTRLALEAFNRRRAMPFQLPDRDLFGTVAETRRLIAQLLSATPEEVGLTVNTSFGLGVMARALPLERGDVVLVSDREFPANVYPWIRLRELGITVELLPTTAAGWPDEARMLDRLTDPRVRAVAVSLVQFSSGYRVDLEALSAATRRTGAWLVVDAIQGVGQLPLDLSRVQVDILACGGQKWLLSPWGSGFVYVRRELIARLDPTGHGVDGLRGHRRPDAAHGVRRHPACRRPPLRADHAPVPGLRRHERLVGVDPRARRGAYSAAHLQRLHQPVLAWAERDRRAGDLTTRCARIGYPLPRAGRGRRRPPPSQGGAHHLQPARGIDPPEPARVQHGRGDGTGRGRTRRES